MMKMKEYDTVFIMSLVLKSLKSAVIGCLDGYAAIECKHLGNLKVIVTNQCSVVL
jgi:hypothetical protein